MLIKNNMRCYKIKFEERRPYNIKNAAVATTTTSHTEIEIGLS